VILARPTHGDDNPGAPAERSRVNPADVDTGTEAARRTPPLPQLVVELRELVIAYFKQETIVPLQQLGRYVAFGVLGAILLGTGAVFWGIAGLRALQTETDTALTGNWSWVPYLIMVVVLLLAGLLAWKGRGTVQRKKERT
jgi:hypothetical protein